MCGARSGWRAAADGNRVQTELVKHLQTAELAVQLRATRVAATHCPGTRPDRGGSEVAPSGEQFGLERRGSGRCRLHRKEPLSRSSNSTRGTAPSGSTCPSAQSFHLVEDPRFGAEPVLLHPESFRATASRRRGHPASRSERRCWRHRRPECVTRRWALSAFSLEARYGIASRELRSSKPRILSPAQQSAQQSPEAEAG